jgi:hypothetical protein
MLAHERLTISPLLLCLSSPRSTARSSLRHKSPVHIIAVRYSLCRYLLKIFTESRTPSAQYILTVPAPAPGRCPENTQFHTYMAAFDSPRDRQ